MKDQDYKLLFIDALPRLFPLEECDWDFWDAVESIYKGIDLSYEGNDLGYAVSLARIRWNIPQVTVHNPTDCQLEDDGMFSCSTPTINLFKPGHGTYMASWDTAPSELGQFYSPEAGLQIQRPTHAVWYHSVGCLPDHDEGPGWEFAGTESECEQWLADHADDYDTSVLYTLYYEPIEWED